MLRILAPIYLIALLLANSSAFCQEVSTRKKYDLTALVERALNRSEFVASFRARREQRYFTALQTRKWQNPQLGFGVARKKVDPFNYGPQYTIGISQPFFLPGKKALREEIADIDVEIAKLEESQTELTLANDVVRFAYEYTINRRKKEFADERQERFKVIQNFLAGRPFAAPQKKAESRIVENRLRDLNKDSLLTQTAFKTSFENLNLYAGFDQKDFPDIEVIWFAGNAIFDESKWLTQAIENNLGLTIQRNKVEGAKKESKLASLEPLPDFSIDAFYGKEARNEKEKIMGIGITLPIPVFDQNQGNIRSAEKKIEAEEMLQRFGVQRLQTQFRQVLAELEAAKQTVRSYPEKLLATMKQQLKETEEEFRKGRVDLLTLLEFDTQASETYSNVLAAQYTLMDRLLTLLFLSGEKDFISQLRIF